MNPTKTGNSPWFGIAWGIGGFAVAALCAWEYFRTGDQGLRVVMPALVINGIVVGVIAIARRNRIRPPTDTRYRYWTIALSLIPIALAVAGVWIYAQSGDIFNLIWSPFVLALGVWGVTVGLRELKRQRTTL